ncbi:MAG: hypothetical protein IPN47_24335 [Gemmatimonadetes bacterium]|nr:hypothetical protein [Gemmatimonadota bacterium]
MQHVGGAGREVIRARVASATVSVIVTIARRAIDHSPRARAARHWSAKVSSMSRPKSSRKLRG